MIRPNCHYVYVLGVTKCPDCGADLVYKLPPNLAISTKKPAQPSDLVVVYISSDRANAVIAKSILGDAGIEYLIMDDWRGGGRVAFRVSSDDAEEARALLAGLN